MKIVIEMKDDCRTAVITSENGFYVEQTDLDNSFPVDSDSILSCIFDSREEFGISNESWVSDDIMNPDYSEALQFLDFIDSLNEGIKNNIEFRGV